MQEIYADHDGLIWIEEKRRALRPVFSVFNQRWLFAWLVGAFDFVKHEVGDDLRTG